ncbi:c-type cytochrome [Roseibium denhamense]|uniref:Cytochrome c, mono-and diheme variants n=1 Tax=Roseibium denhamense TaxID=76305 RepID=A0ABY1N6P7_9HYPH|nr:cytochrome c [Roseibium denhamense]MTI06107.1 c-type cytochrome [Roseibium denhamense]SMP01135.1 Cytochrome c, mono-and diheme variants [Roseibium denhamense]
MKTLLAIAAGLVLAGGAAAWTLSAPTRIQASQAGLLSAGNPEAGETVFWAGGCASCHAAAGAKGEDLLKLGGGLRLETPFGIFVAPNISSSSTDGIGAWTVTDFANAMLHGTSPDGRNYYPAFPYTSYARMTPEDISDLFAFMKTLPSVEGRAAGHELAFPFNLRRGLGLWKRVFLDPSPVVLGPVGEVDEQLWERGRYLVEGPGHCGECHTKRDFAGGLVLTAWLGGAPAPTGKGTVPNITQGDANFASWSASDIAYYLESGFTPEYDSVGGEMVHVQENMAKLPARDREAIAAYLKAIPSVSSTSN